MRIASTNSALTVLAVTWSFGCGELPKAPVNATDVKAVVQSVVDFRMLPPEEKIKSSSVVFVVEYQRDRGKARAMITEILKRTPDAVFVHAVGDEYPDLNRNAKSGVQYDGEVCFIAAASFLVRECTTYVKNMIDGLGGGMTLSTLRELATRERP